MRKEKMNKKNLSVSLSDLRLLNKIFGSLKVETIEAPESIFNGIGILDVFNYCLSEDEARKYLWIDGFGQKHVDKYLNFIRDVYQLNHSEPVFVKIDKFFDKLHKNNSFNRAIHELAPKERSIFLNLLLNDEYFLKVNELEVLNTLVKLIAMEEVLSTFYFPKTETVLIGNYDLSLPLYSKHEITFKEYEKLAHKNKLYIR
jgi:hypothetical protein